MIRELIDACAEMAREALAVPHDPKDEVLFRDYPIWPWLGGLMTGVVGLIVGPGAWERLLFGLAAAALVVFPSILTVSADRAQRVLALRYRSLVRGTTKLFPFDEISGIHVSEDWERERMYRVELLLGSGRVVPLRSWYTLLAGPKQRRARRLLDALGRAGEAG